MLVYEDIVDELSALYLLFLTVETAIATIASISKSKIQVLLSYAHTLCSLRTHPPENECKKKEIIKYFVKNQLKSSLTVAAWCFQVQSKTWKEKNVKNIRVEEKD